MNKANIIKNLFIQNNIENDVESVYRDDQLGMYVVKTEGGHEYLVGDLDEAKRAAIEEAAIIFEDCFSDETLLKWFDDNSYTGLDDHSVCDLIRELYDPENVMEELDNLEYIYDFVRETGLTLEDLKDYGLDADMIKPYIDYEEVGEYIVDVDGIEHILARYDGQEIYLGNDLFAYRVD